MEPPGGVELEIEVKNAVDVPEVRDMIGPPGWIDGGVTRLDVLWENNDLVLTIGRPG